MFELKAIQSGCPIRVPALPEHLPLVIGRAAWVTYFLAIGFPGGAIWSFYALLLAIPSFPLPRHRIIHFLVIIGASLFLMRNGADWIGYLPLAAAWLGIASNWSDNPITRKGVVVFGEITWILFGLVATSWPNVICATLPMLFLLALPRSEWPSFKMPKNLSPSLL